MNTLQIEELLKSDPWTKKIFKGVFARDQLPKIIYPSAYIVNTQPIAEPGEHWIAIYFDENKNGECFDSYGLPPQVYGLDAFMDRNSKRWTYNQKTLQSLFSATCGHYCIYFILFRSRGHSMQSITSRFSKNLTENDRKITRFVRTHFYM